MQIFPCAWYQCFAVAFLAAAFGHRKRPSWMEGRGAGRGGGGKAESLFFRRWCRGCAAKQAPRPLWYVVVRDRLRVWLRRGGRGWEMGVPLRCLPRQVFVLCPQMDRFVLVETTEQPPPLPTVTLRFVGGRFRLEYVCIISVPLPMLFDRCNSRALSVEQRQR